MYDDILRVSDLLLLLIIIITRGKGRKGSALQEMRGRGKWGKLTLNER